MILSEWCIQDWMETWRGAAVTQLVTLRVRGSITGFFWKHVVMSLDKTPKPPSSAHE